VCERENWANGEELKQRRCAFVCRLYIIRRKKISEEIREDLIIFNLNEISVDYRCKSGRSVC
jgi:hypothetical protein